MLFLIMVIFIYPLLFKYPEGVYNVDGEIMKKLTIRSGQEKKKLLNRLNRIEGQVRGVKRMITEDQYCNDILIQLAAIDKSVQSLSIEMLESHLYRCISNDMKDGNIETIDEVIQLFRRFQK